MKSIKTVISFVLLLILFLLLINGTYLMLSPIAYLLLCVLVFSVLFFTIISFSKAKYNQFTQENLLTIAVAKRLGIFFLLTLFGISIVAIRDYQLPNNDAPYFSNSDYHAIRNESVAFNSKIELYSPETDGRLGLWPMETGHFFVVADNLKAELNFSGFFKPVFGYREINGERMPFLLNPQFSIPLTSGFKIEDEQNILVFTQINKVVSSGLSSLFRKKGKFNYDIEIIFQTKDPEITDVPISDTISFKEVTLEKGLEIRDLVYKNKSRSAETSLRLIRWLGEFKSIQILFDHDLSGEYFLSLFASEDVYNSGVAFKNGDTILKPKTGSKIEFPLSSHFFVGLGNNRDSLSITLADNLSPPQFSGYSHKLNFLKPEYKKITQLEEIGKPNATTEIRFLENDFADSDGFKIKEGIVFQKGLKLNQTTALDSVFLRFTNSVPGTILNWDIWANNESVIVNKKENKFLLKSRGPNTKLGWIYSIRDFSHNRFSFPRMVVYFSILTLFILCLLIFSPSPRLITVETPIWMVIYGMIVFRFILLWRLATFPPLENISITEFNTLVYFEFRFMNLSLPLPFSLIITLSVIGLIVIKRTKFFGNTLNPKDWLLFESISKISNKISFRTGKWKNILYHFCTISIGFILMKVMNQEFLVRLMSIVLPISSYFYHYSIIVKQNLKIDYNHLNKFQKRSWYVTQFLKYWIETPVFFLSLTTFLYLGFADRGFAVIFLIFLITKNIFLNFSKGNQLTNGNRRSNQLLSPQNFWIYGLLALFLFLTIISFKSFTHYLLEYKRWGALALLVIIFGSAYLLARQNVVRKVSLFMGIALLSGLSINPVWNKVDEGIDSLIQHVKYRANVIHQPFSEILLKEGYQTGQEQKIVETAQNQWFINSYLGQARLLPKKIDFKPHFNKGVNYSTQTRDVVLPRFIIAEFGGVTMLLLILLIFTPLILYTLSFRLSEPNKYVFHPDGIIGSLALTLLATIALVVWMSSTNRFVFFGQDFPFMSLTSRITVLIPLICFFVVLTGNPIPRFSRNGNKKYQLIRWALFFIGTGIFIGFAGKSKQLNETNFKPNFSGVSTRINETLNEFFVNVQQIKPPKLGVASTASKKELEAQIILWLAELKKDPDYATFFNTKLTNYERSFLNELSVNPAKGFDQRYPVHIINNGDLFTFKFNDYLHFELPAYDIKRVWTGEVFEEIKGTNINIAGLPEAEIIIIPSSLQKAGKKPYAIIDKTGTGKQVQIYNTKLKGIITYKHTDPVFKLADEDIVLYRDNKYNAYKIWTLGDYDKRFFVRNIKVNGARKMVYPLAKDFYWIREWAETNKGYNEKVGGSKLELSSIINLDYELTRNTGKYLNELMNSALANKLTNSNKVIFSVIAVDGAGRIRLMSDAAMGGLRTSIDPNNERAIAQKIEEGYFFRNNEASRLQWGNTNLLHMRHGPGSSIKPLMLAAVASQKKMEWDIIKYKNHPTVRNDTDTHFIIERYAGKNLPTKSGRWREPTYNNNYADLNLYLAKSHNLYHSLIIFLGSYNKSDFENTNSLIDVLKIPTIPNDFPLLTLGSSITYTLKDPPFWPKNNQGLFFGNNNSMLASGLYENLALATNSDTSTGQLIGKIKFTQQKSDILKHGLWAFPEKSFFNQQERTIDFQHAIQMTTLGGGIFRLTPIHTIEMYGKMFNYDRNFTVSIDDSIKNPEPWSNVDEEWMGRYKEDFLKPQVFKGMENVITSGTAKYLAKLRTLYPNFDFYAKTGTIGASIGDNSKRLIVVISRKGDLSGTKNYYIYFTVQNAYREDRRSHKAIHKTWFEQPIIDCIEKIIQSESFKNYISL